jgi:hypothetical protein
MYYHIACRKYIFQLMIVKCHPYVGKDEDALNIINNWLIKCGKLDQNFNYMVRYALKNSAKNQYRPLKLDTLKLKNNALYQLLIDQ